MKRKAQKMINYPILKNDWMLVNIVVGVVALLTFLYMVLQRMDILPSLPCPIHDILHVYCPGCGGTRAIFAMLQGKIIESLYCNPAILLGVLLVLHYEIGVVVTLMKKNGKRYYCNNLILVIIYIVVILAFSVVRNYLLIEYGVDMLEDFSDTQASAFFHILSLC